MSSTALVRKKTLDRKFDELEKAIHGRSLHIAQCGKGDCVKYARLCREKADLIAALNFTVYKYNRPHISIHA